MARVTNTTSGNPASFHSPGSVPIRSLKVHFDPVQNLNGYDKPWVGGAGKNLLDWNKVTISSTPNYGIVLTKESSEGIITVSGTLTNTGGTIAPIAYADYSLSGKNYVFLTEHINGDSFVELSGTFGLRTENEKAIAIKIVGTANQSYTETIRISVYETAASSWEPYENICPITGWTGISYNYSNKNILPAKVPADAIKGTFGTGSTSISSATNAICFSVYVGKNRQLKFSKKVSGSLMFAFTDNKVVDRTQTIYSAVNCANRESYTFNSGDHPWLLINSSNKSGYESFTDATAPMMRFSEDSVDYASRIDWTPKSVNWTNEAGELFGGYIDVVSGDLVATHKKVRIDRNLGGWTYNYFPDVDGGEGGVRFRGPDVINCLDVAEAYSDTCSVCNCLPKIPNQEAIPTTPGIMIGYMEYILIRHVTALFGIENNVDALLNYLDTHQVDVTYKLATPIIYHLTPQEITSFTSNKIWSNADNLVEAEYDYAESIDILKARSLMIANAPHLETAISSSNVLSINSNVESSLKECKVYFNPIQEGSGEPSPTNIRNFTGWDSVILHNSNNARLLFPATNDDVIDVLHNGALLRSLGDGKYKIIRIDPEDYPTYRFDLDIPSGVLSNNMDLYFNSDVKHSLPAWSIAFSLRDASDNNVIQGEVAYSATLNDFTSIGTTGTASGKTYAKFRTTFVASFIDTTICPVISSTTMQEDVVANITWTSTAGTLYGGYIDLVSGKLVATHKKVLLNTSNQWFTQVSGNYTFYYYNVTMSDRYVHDKFEITCSIAPDGYSMENQNTNLWHVQFNTSAGYYPILMWNNVDYTAPVTLAELKTLSANNQVSICYPLANPIEYQLTPQNIMSFLGQNTIWSNANGGIEIKYWTH